MCFDAFSGINHFGHQPPRPKHPSSHGQVPELHYARDAWSSPTQGAIAGLLVLSLTLPPYTHDNPFVPQYLPRSRRQSSSWSSISPPETATVNRGHRLVNYEPGSGLLGCIYCSQEGSTPHFTTNSRNFWIFDPAAAGPKPKPRTAQAFDEGFSVSRPTYTKSPGTIVQPQTLNQSSAWFQGVTGLKPSQDSGPQPRVRGWLAPCSWQSPNRWR